MKESIAYEPILKLPDFELPFRVLIDASDKAIRGVLVQEDQHVSFNSRKLNDAKQSYSKHEIKMVIVLHCLLVRRVYLLGTEFVVRNDSLENTFFKTQKKLSPKQAIW